MRRLVLTAAALAALWAGAAGAQDVPWMPWSSDGAVLRLTVDKASDGGLEWLFFRHGVTGAWVSLPAANWAIEEFDIAAALAAALAAELAQANDEEGNHFTYPRSFLFGRQVELEELADGESGNFGVLGLLAPVGMGPTGWAGPYAYRTRWPAAALHTEHILALIQPLVGQERVAEAAVGDAPEPSIWVLMGIGFASLGYAAYRRRRLAPAAA